MKPLTRSELQVLIAEEIENLDEGWWDKVKGTFAGMGSALTSDIGQIGQGYQRGKASSALKTAARDLIEVKDEFIDNIEGLFKTPFAKMINLSGDIADMADKWNSATSKIDEAARELEMLSMEVKIPSRGKQVRVGAPSSDQSGEPRRRLKAPQAAEE